jgi:hypothetical protein
MGKKKIEYYVNFDPPDYINVKNSLNNIIRSQDYKNIICDAVARIQKIAMHSCMFLKLWILHNYNSNNDVPYISKLIIKLSSKVFTIDKGTGRPPSEESSLLFKKLINFHDEHYKKLYDGVKIDSCNLSHILDNYAISMFTAIENNIKCHFFDYIRRFVNGYFQKEHDEIISKIKGQKDKLKMQKQLKSELYVLKNDLFNGTKNCLEKYHKWLDTYRYKILPEKYTTSYYYDIKCNPQNYLKYMIYMVSELEKLGVKLFQFFPLRTSFIPKYITIDTASLIDLFVEGKKEEYLNNISKYKEDIWKSFFNTNLQSFKRKNYKFDHHISTDGFATSIQLIHKSYAYVSEFKKQKKLEGRRNNKGKTKEEKELIKKEKAEKVKRDAKEFQDKIKKLPKEEQKQLRAERKQIKKFIKKKKTIKYLEDLSDYDMRRLKRTKKVYVDPGKKTLLYMMDDNKTILRYTNSQRLKETKRLKYQKTIKKYKDDNGITDIENRLKDYNSKTINVDKFKEYIRVKNETINILLEKYKAEIFRKYRWYGYINRERSDSNLTMRIKKTFGKDFIYIYGDWNIGRQLSNFISTPNIRLKRRLGKYNEMINFDEFRTSCLYYKTQEKCENMIVYDKKEKKFRSLHSVLTFRMENKRSGCINRDRNAIYAYKRITEYQLKYKERPQKYRRTYDFLEKGVEKTIKDPNPSKGKTQGMKKQTKQGNIKPKKKHKGVKSDQTERSFRSSSKNIPKKNNN